MTELVTGVDLVKAQLRIAAGEPLDAAGIPAEEAAAPRGHALECRVCAEDPAEGFRPSPGPILVLDEPSGPGVRVDSGLREGWQVPAAYDSLLAKVIVWDRTRADAVVRMEQALARFVILGCGTNVTFLRDVIAHDAFRRAETTTDFLERHFTGWRPEPSMLALAAAAALASTQPPSPAQTGAQPGRGSAEDRSGAWDPWDGASGWRIGESRG